MSINIRGVRLAPGSRLGPYAIESALGAGGMGEVYRARDTRLDRSVAVKVLADAVANDPQFRERFEREARTISTLSHPHICTLFDVGHESNIPYLVMELLEGDTLAARLTRGSLAPSQALSIAIQIGGALAAAHRVGIIHRDLKPGNIMITRRADAPGEPHAKLLDFGVARSASRDSDSATTQVALTEAGEAIGTIPYMSPEQLEGRPPDARSDIWSFGCVLYEMFAGRRAFAGTNNARLISDILTSEPAPITPASLDRLIRKCLAKDPERRWQTSADLTDELQWIGRLQATGGDTSAPSATQTERPRRWHDGILAGGGLILAALTFLGGYALRPAPEVPRVTRYELEPPPGSEWGDGLAVSPDGRRLAFLAVTAGKAHVWIRDLDKLEARQLAGTDGASIAPFWSPDSSSIGFFAKGRLKTISADGGAVIDLASAKTPGGGAWNRDGVIVYSPDLFATDTAKGLWQVPARGGGKPVSLTTPADETHRGPVFLPDGRHLLYTAAGGGDPIVFATSLDDPDKRTPVVSNASSVAFVSPGHVLFVRDRQLWSQRFDPEALTLSGEEVMTAASVDQFAFRSHMFVFSVSDSGVLFYRSTMREPVRQFVWVDRTGRELKRLPVTGALRDPVLSPDEKHVAFEMEQSGNVDIHVFEFATGLSRRRTFSPAADLSPVWSHDSQSIAFRRQGNIFEVPIDSKGTERLLLAKDDKVTNLYPRSYSADGSAIIYLGYRVGSTAPNGGIYELPLAGGRAPRTWLDSPANEGYPELSPNGRWMVYALQQGAGGAEIYVQKYPEGGAKAQVSEDDSASGVYWRGDGPELFYPGQGSFLMAVPMKEGVPSGPVTALFPLGPGFPLNSAGLASSKDGQRFLVNRPASGSDKRTLTVVTNWLTALKK